MQEPLRIFQTLFLEIQFKLLKSESQVQWQASWSQLQKLFHFWWNCIQMEIPAMFLNSLIAHGHFHLNKEEEMFSLTELVLNNQDASQKSQKDQMNRTRLAKKPKWRSENYKEPSVDSLMESAETSKMEDNRHLKLLKLLQNKATRPLKSLWSMTSVAMRTASKLSDGTDSTQLILSVRDASADSQLTFHQEAVHPLEP